ncbi:MAG: sarcosine oxidase, gamma subunit [Alphaproteobacteria bacterium]|nr:sarcosine oxidase, gamma subunit [Alphaproteobacteria bacterium]
MAEARLVPRTPLEDMARPGRYGLADGPAGVLVQERADRVLASVIARHGQGGAVAEAVRSAFSLDLPPGPRRIAARGVAFTGVGPDQWLVAAEGDARRDFVARLGAALAGRAAVADQSDGRVVLEVSGPRVLDALAKGIPVDLHPAVFTAGAAANTLVAYIGVQITRIGDALVYELMASRSLAGSLWSWLATSAAEHGLELRQPRRG